MKKLKEIITSVALSSLLTLAPTNILAKENFNLNNNYNLDIVSEIDSKNFAFIQLAQNSYLIYKDIFEQTKPALKIGV